MLAKKYRLTAPEDFKRVQNEGRVFQSSDFGVAVFDRNDTNPPRFGFIVSTKVAKDATDRNRIRRAMSESVRSAALEVRSGLDIVFLSKTTIVKSPTDKIMKDVKFALNEGKLTK